MIAPSRIPENSMPRLLAENLPKHVGIIMDGNGRWAKSKKMPRTFGHRQGLEAAKRIVRAAGKFGVSCLSLYTFSTENWKRAEDEVNFLMDLILHHLRNEYEFYRENRIRVLHSGDLGRLPGKIQEEIRKVKEDTAEFDKLTVNLAINYGGRDEIVRGILRFMDQKKASPGANGSETGIGGFLKEQDFSDFLDTPEIPDVDLIIRSGGEQRISNFLLWKSAYAELYFSDKLWPDWEEEDLLAALLEYQHRQRRFGGTP